MPHLICEAQQRVLCDDKNANDSADTAATKVRRCAAAATTILGLFKALATNQINAKAYSDALFVEGVYGEQTTKHTYAHIERHAHMHARAGKCNEIDFLHFFLLLAIFADGNQLHKLTVAGAPTAIKIITITTTAIAKRKTKTKKKCKNKKNTQ